MKSPICEVRLIFKEKIRREKVEEYILKVVKKDKFDILEVKENEVIVYFYPGIGYDEDEIETVLFDILEGGELGQYDYFEVEEQ